MSDDEFDLISDAFDDADLAVIDEMEHKFTVAASQAPPGLPKQAVTSPTNTSINLPNKAAQDRSRFLHPPPPKRVRTNEWSVTSVPNREYEDDTPDYAVIAAKDGKYRILESGANPRTTSLAVPSGPMASQQQQRPMASQRSFSGPLRIASTSNAVPSSQRFPASQSRFAAITAALQDTNLGNTGAEDEMRVLREQLAELRRAKEETEAALKTAREEKFTKEGEISTIRRTIASLKESHAQTIAKVQAEKQAAEDKRRQTERQMKQEMERLQTNLALRRQELETSTRKTSWSARKQRITGPTPGRSTSYQQLPANETPSRPTRLKIPIKEPEAVPKSAKGKGKPPAFPAFVDSFQNTSPVKTPSKSQRNTREAAKGGPVPDMESMFPPIFHLDSTTPSVPSRSRTVSFGRNSQSATSVRSVMEEESGPDWVETFEASPLILEREVTGLTLEEEAEVQNEMLEDDVEEDEPETSLDWKEQLYRILFAHVSLPLYQFTLQMLLSTHIPEQSTIEVGAYVQESSALVEALAPRAMDYNTVLRAVIKALLRMARILCDTSSSVALAGIFSLLATMCLFLPKTASTLLSEEVDSTFPPILGLFVDVIKSHASPKEVLSGDGELLVKECLNLLQTLCLKVPKELLNQMRPVFVEPMFTSFLLDARQPLWILQSTAESLSILFSYDDAFSILLAPLQDPNSDKIPLLERLSHMLLEPIAATGLQEKQSLQKPILAIFSQLAISSPKELSVLSQSQALIPALVTNLFHYSARAWEEDEDSFQESDLLVIGNIIQSTLRLLHYIVFQSEPQVNLQQRIQYPPPKMNDLEHMFVVGLGRLSYADPPEWSSKPAKDALENAAGLARELLESVVDGPEVDAIWTSFQDSEENHGSDTDDEEMEARKVAQTDEEMNLNE
ncbi:hypothetical protein M408DRAFT_22563 [Serendipita vermifera MAFF 305830]|uniref:Uncharacterized protein n=1 Tax=Serendipita vermifera MAFF 305830 TaxID=933852 RepID=A0A0C3AYS6_SERVB|nr:hypothetical protein M408DRAFT_22563 [Serendipita vermifera MAFF 305830]